MDDRVDIPRNTPVQRPADQESSVPYHLRALSTDDKRNAVTLPKTASFLGYGDEEEAIGGAAQSLHNHKETNHDFVDSISRKPDLLDTQEPTGEGTRLRTIEEHVSVKPSTGNHPTEVRSLPQTVNYDEKREWHSHGIGRDSIRRRPWTSSEKRSVPLFPSCYLSSEEDASSLPRAAIPPFTPPHRMNTPIGIPRWPRDVRHEESATISKRHNVLDMIRHRRLSGATFRNAITDTGHHPLPCAGQRSAWRPPVSGHSTYRFADLSIHPFVSGKTIQA